MYANLRRLSSLQAPLASWSFYHFIFMSTDLESKKEKELPRSPCGDDFKVTRRSTVIMANGFQAENTLAIGFCCVHYIRNFPILILRVVQGYTIQMYLIKYSPWE
jgi:hypothetical protein